MALLRAFLPFVPSKHPPAKPLPLEGMGPSALHPSALGQPWCLLFLAVALAPAGAAEGQGGRGLASLPPRKTMDHYSC